MEIQLSKKQMEKIQYESMLLRMTPQQLYVVAPHLFNENITAANTKVEEKEITEQIDSIEKEFKSLLQNDDEEDSNTYGDYYY